jgi:hypothetical protein
MRHWYRRVFVALILISVAVAAPTLAANDAAGYAKIAGTLALIGYPVHSSDTKLTIAFGTGFVVTSNDHSSILVTANHVIAPSGGDVEPNLFAYLPSSPKVQHHVTVIRHDANLDIAVVAIDVGNLPVVSVNKNVPDKGDHVAIAGFPFSETCELAGMCGNDFLAPHNHAGELHDELSTGSVSDAQAGEWGIVINLVADHGDSGGPLFDADSGDVYGVVTDALRGFSDNLTPPQVYNNRAIAMNVVASYISASPGVSVAYDAGGSTRGVGGSFTDSYSDGSGSAACVAAWKQFDAAYSEFIAAHGLLQSLAAYAASPRDPQRLAQVHPAAAHVPVVERDTLLQMKSAVAAMTRASAPGIAATGMRVVAVAGTVRATDATVAASAQLSTGLAAIEAGNARIVPVADEMNNVTDCE